MCGVAGFYLKPGARINSDSLQKLSDYLLEEIEHRGGHAVGFVARNLKGELLVEKAACDDVGKFVVERQKLLKDVHVFVGHTRFATQGHQGFMHNNHPVSCGHFYVTHNGHINNDDELIKRHGYERVGRVDSEAIAHAFRAHGFTNATLVMESLSGAAAVAALDSKSGEIVLARGFNSPLVVVETKNLWIWASEGTAIRSAWSKSLGTPPNWKKFHYMGEGELWHLTPSGDSTVKKFIPYEPYFNGWVAPKKWIKVVHNGKTYMYNDEDASVWESCSTVESDSGTDNPTMIDDLEICSCCNDWYVASDLWEIYQGFNVCWKCEAKLVDEGMDSDDIMTLVESGVDLDGVSVVDDKKDDSATLIHNHTIHDACGLDCPVKQALMLPPGTDGT